MFLWSGGAPPPTARGCNARFPAIYWLPPCFGADQGIGRSVWDEYTVLTQQAISSFWHEDRHVQQCMVLGPFFGVAYWFGGRWAKWKGLKLNPLELDANLYALKKLGLPLP